MAQPTSGRYATRGRALELERELRAVERRMEARVREATKRADEASARADAASVRADKVLGAFLDYLRRNGAPSGAAA